jgi:hypothetical protein
LLELHGFDGQISAPILYLSNNILHASRVVWVSQQLVIWVTFVFSILMVREPDSRLLQG